MIIKREIGAKGQVVIPIDIRRMLNLHSGDNIIFEIATNNEIKVKPEQNPEEWVEDFLNVPKLKRRIPWKKIKEELGERHDIH